MRKEKKKQQQKKIITRGSIVFRVFFFSSFVVNCKNIKTIFGIEVVKKKTKEAK